MILARILISYKKSGAWYSYNGDRLGQGRENAKIFLKENEALFEEISGAIRDHYELDKDLEQPEEKIKRRAGKPGSLI